MYLHASPLAAVSVGAPGMVNSLDPSRDWFVGVRDVEEKFGQDIDRHGLYGLPVQVVVGGSDIGHDIMVEPSNPLYMEGVNDAGATRVERSGFLHRALMRAGVRSQLDIVPGASHQAQDAQLAVDEFFRKLHEPPSGATAEKT